MHVLRDAIAYEGNILIASWIISAGLSTAVAVMTDRHANVNSYDLFFGAPTQKFNIPSHYFVVIISISFCFSSFK